ncbi:hypothetical protein GWK36_13135 [Caldichromatium japonicum]|uniref:Calcineurin-like phosphoesterase domain-containing protein n=1 Tax=Caldichromatium japonicum TaxID=2699430 RepID=A0A6G7VFT5_9GAMM|nr:hypothetical protein GWK36_13135 [Caldichromatium japonicum]
MPKSHRRGLFGCRPKICPRVGLKAALLWLSLTAGWTVGAGAAGPDTFPLTLIYLNDHHAHLDPDLGLKLHLPELGSVTIESGEMDRVAALIRSLRTRYPQSLVLHAGDALIGTPYDRLFQGETDAEAMRHICLDALALGNHEFDRGDSSLARFIQRLNQDPARCHTAVLAANVAPALATLLYPRPGMRLIQQEAILKAGEERIGVIRLIAADKTQRSSHPLPTTVFQNELTVAQARIDALKAQGIDKIVLLTHQGYRWDLKLAAGLEGADVIVSGDSHTLLGEDFRRLGLEPAGPYPTIASDRSGHKVCIVQAWEYAKAVGELHVSFNQEGQVIACTGQTHLVLGERLLQNGQGLSEAVQQNARALIAALPGVAFIQPDPEFKQALAPYRTQVAQLEQEHLGVAAQDLCPVNWSPVKGPAPCATGVQPSHTAAMSNNWSLLPIWRSFPRPMSPSSMSAGSDPICLPAPSAARPSIASSPSPIPWWS